MDEKIRMRTLKKLFDVKGKCTDLLKHITVFYVFETGNNDLIRQSFRRECIDAGKSGKTLFIDYPATESIRVGMYMEYDKNIDSDGITLVIENVLISLAGTYEEDGEIYLCKMNPTKLRLKEQNILKNVKPFKGSKN